MSFCCCVQVVPERTKMYALPSLSVIILICSNHGVVPGDGHTSAEMVT